MATRLNIVKASSGAYRAMPQLDHFVKNCGLELSLIELVEICASQINGGVYSIDVHTKDARAAGESKQRIICFLSCE
jgi:AhpD family alkylhydroperoxidase